MNIDSGVWERAIGSFYTPFHLLTKSNDTCKRKCDLIQNLHFLPNEEIAKEFTRILNIYPVKPYLDSRASFVRWMHFIHNEVNRITGKEYLPYNSFIQSIKN